MRCSDKSLVQIITSLLKWRPDERVNASVLLQHPYIKECANEDGAV